jgi:hypothetical protein
MALIGVPLKVLHEAEGHIITVETTTGEVRVEYFLIGFILSRWSSFVCVPVFIMHKNVGGV